MVLHPPPYTSLISKLLKKHKGICEISQMDTPPDPSTSAVQDCVSADAQLDTYCGLCGKRGTIYPARNSALTHMYCCNRVVCDDEEGGDRSCFRHHSRHSLCTVHYKYCNPRKRPADWRDCTTFIDHVSYMEWYIGWGSSRWNFREDKWHPPYMFQKSRFWACRLLQRSAASGGLVWSLYGLPRCH